MKTPVRIAITPGEPAGIGPDLCLQLAQQSQQSELITVCDPVLLEDRARLLGINIQLHEFLPDSPAKQHVPGQLFVLPVTMPSAASCGKPNTDNARYVLQTLDAAMQACQQGTVGAMVTGPVHKGLINDAGIPFSGHTEYLAKHFNLAQGVMMLAAPGIRVALVTTHLPLAAVPKAITSNRLKQVIQTLHDELQLKFGISKPNILVCGLNPHSGEGGHLGMEEIETIAPTLDILRDQGLNLVGPIPADTAFTPHYLSATDVVLAMYHDQGLPVLKHLGFGKAVNITLGLPIIRTSVDHGTALDLAGTGQADAGSLQAALDLATQMAQRAAMSQ